ncbi:MAG: CGNR zinc finger domain-containing protein [Thermomicrobiales bacterium]
MSLASQAIETGEHPPLDDFVFVGESLALDLVNTAIVARGKPRDLLATPADLAAWWRHALTHYPDIALVPGIPHSAMDDPALLAPAKALRAALRAIFEADIAGAPVAASDLEILNRILRSGYEAIAIEPGDIPRPQLGSHDTGPDATLLPIARSAFDLLTGKDLARLHRCANERCVLLFYDTTKSATRRWCSVGCMNRARSLRRYRERKLAVPAPAATSPSSPRRGALDD